MKIGQKNLGVERAIMLVGGQVALAKKLGVKQPAISYYLYQRCPAEKAIAIEELTGIGRAEIRPDLFNKVKTAKGADKKISRRPRPTTKKAA